MEPLALAWVMSGSIMGWTQSGVAAESSASKMFNTGFEWPQHLLDGTGLGYELVGPRRVRLHDFDGIFRCIAPLLSIMCHW